jgi:hypothetical protein
MTTKVLTGSYSSGYTLAPAYYGLDLTSTAKVGGSGVLVGQTGSVLNSGTVTAAGGHYAGVYMQNAGTVDNSGVITGLCRDQDHDQQHQPHRKLDRQYRLHWRDLRGGRTGRARPSIEFRFDTRLALRRGSRFIRHGAEPGKHRRTDGFGRLLDRRRTPDQRFDQEHHRPDLGLVRRAHRGVRRDDQQLRHHHGQRQGRLRRLPGRRRIGDERSERDDGGADRRLWRHRSRGGWNGEQFSGSSRRTTAMARASTSGPAGA